MPEISRRTDKLEAGADIVEAGNNCRKVCAKGIVIKGNYCKTEKNNYTIYRFSKESKIPKTTLLDLCSGKTSIYKSQAITIKKIADTLGVSMEYVMSLENVNKDYLEFNIPDFLRYSIDMFNRNIKTSLYDIYYCTLQSDINVAEIGGNITPNQASFLRKKSRWVL